MGYFRIFYYITYILNFILRIIKRHGKAVLWFICIFIFLVLALYNPKSQAVYIGNDTYTDSQQNVLSAYNGVVLDFVRRFDNFRKTNPNNSAINSFLGYVGTNFSRSFYIFYDNETGISMVNGAPYNQYYMYVLVFQPSSAVIDFESSLYDDYLGNMCDIKKLTPTTNSSSTSTLWRIGQNTFERMPDLIRSYYMPSILYNYYNDYFVDYFYNNYTIQEIEILAEMDEKLGNVDETLQQQQEFLEQEPSSEDFSTSDLPTSSGVTATTDNGLNTLFSSLYNVFTGQPNNQHNIVVNVPFTR